MWVEAWEFPFLRQKGSREGLSREVRVAIGPGRSLPPGCHQAPQEGWRTEEKQEPHALESFTTLCVYCIL